MEKMIEKIDNLFKDIPDKPLGFICFLKENLKDIYDKLNIKSVYIISNKFSYFNIFWHWKVKKIAKIAIKKWLFLRTNVLIASFFNI